jgi:hypothetical protein
MADRDFSDWTWEEYRDWVAERPGRGSRLSHKRQVLRTTHMADGDLAYRIIGEDRARLFDDVYQFAPEDFDGPMTGYDSQVFEYMWYRQLVLDDEGTPTDFSR